MKCLLLFFLCPSSQLLTQQPFPLFTCMSWILSVVIAAGGTKYYVYLYKVFVFLNKMSFSFYRCSSLSHRERGDSWRSKRWECGTTMCCGRLPHSVSVWVGVPWNWWQCGCCRAWENPVSWECLKIFLHSTEWLWLWCFSLLGQQRHWTTSTTMCLPRCCRRWEDMSTFSSFKKKILTKDLGVKELWWLLEIIQPCNGMFLS